MPANIRASTEGRLETIAASPVNPIEVSAGVARLHANAETACDLLRSMAHEGRLMILGLLSLKERSVMELEESLALRQPAVSQQLARLRSDNLVSTRREGKMIYYSLASDEARAIVRVLIGHFGKA